MTYSDKDFTGQDLSSRADMDGLFIENSCFSNETPRALVLPSTLSGTTFSYCNLDNVFIPTGNTLINCSNRFFRSIDGVDWLLDPETLEPIESLT